MASMGVLEPCFLGENKRESSPREGIRREGSISMVFAISEEKLRKRLKTVRELFALVVNNEIPDEEFQRKIDTITIIKKETGITFKGSKDFCFKVNKWVEKAERKLAKF